MAEASSVRVDEENASRPQSAAPTLDDSKEKQDEIETVYPSGLKLAVLLTGLALGFFTVALDNTIIATAIPTITTQFHSLTDVGWYGSAYMLTMTALQPTFGKIYANFSIKITFLTALTIFEVGSVICAAAVNSPMLIVGRAIAGVGGSAIFSGAFNIIGLSAPLDRQPLMFGILSSMFGIASIVGPLLGGAFTDRVTWRWCFWINLPIGGIAFATIFFFFTKPNRQRNERTLREKLAQIDVLGAIFLIAGIACLLLALQWGGTTYAWKNSRIWGLFIGFGLIIFIFIVVQFQRKELATVPPAIISQRTVLVACIVAFLTGMAMFLQVYYLPFYFQAVKGTSAVGSGIRMIPFLLSLSLTSIVTGAGISISGYYVPFLFASPLFYGTGSGLLYTLGVNTSTGRWFGYEILLGIGRGLGMQVPFMAVQAVLKPVDRPIGTAVTMFCNTLGGAVAISIGENIFTNELLKQVPRYAPDVNPDFVISTGATHLREVIPKDLLPGVLEAYAKALDIAFIPAVPFIGVSFLVSLFIERKRIEKTKHVPSPQAEKEKEFEDTV